MATALEECATGEQRSVVRLLWAKGLNAKDIHNKFFLFMVGSVCHVKRFTTGLRNSLKDVQMSQMMPNQVQKWLRQQSEDFYAAGFDTLVLMGHVHQCWWRICRETNVFSVINIICFTFYIHL
jgi:hypothetical protein